MADYVRRIFDDLNPSVLNDGDDNLQRNIAKDAIVALTVRFDRVLICSDCNSAESDAKKGIEGVEQQFTFTPSEIAAFITASANMKHVVDLAAAQEIWEQARADFEDRVDFARRMSQRFANGKNKQEIVRVGRDRSFEDSHYYWVKLIGASPAIGGDSLATQIEKRSVSHDGDGAFSVTKPRRHSRAPTDAEFRLIEQRLSAGKEYWFGLGDDWKCECCKRNKREICRISNRREWTARMHKIRDWETETNRESIFWRQRNAESTLVIGAHRTAYVCQDCRNVVTKLRRLHGDVSESALTPLDITESLVQIDPNTDHNVDYDEALRRAKANAELALAIEDYDRHWQLAWEAEYQYRRQTGYRRKSTKRAYSSWLVEEGRRFREIIESEKAKLKIAQLPD